jgi:hypothetical protein
MTSKKTMKKTMETANLNSGFQISVGTVMTILLMYSAIPYGVIIFSIFHLVFTAKMINLPKTRRNGKIHCSF